MRVLKPVENCKDLTSHAKWVTENTIEITDEVGEKIFTEYRRLWAEDLDYTDTFALWTTTHPFFKYFKSKITSLKVKA